MRIARRYIEVFTERTTILYGVRQYWITDSAVKTVRTHILRRAACKHDSR